MWIEVKVEVEVMEDKTMYIYSMYIRQIQVITAAIAFSLRTPH